MREQEKYSPALLLLLALTFAFFAAAWCAVRPVSAENAYTVTVQREAEDMTAPLRPLVNINAADVTELEKLTGIGGVLAERIIAYREEYGAFASPDDLLAVSGIGEAKLESFRHEITLGGQTP